MNPSVYMTLGEASKATGKSKPTISKYIKSGKLSASLQDNGSYQIDPAELFRVFPQGNTKTLQSLTAKETGVSTQSYTDLKTEIEILRVKLGAETNRANNLEAERDDWKDQAKKLLLQSPQKPTEKRKKFLGIFPYRND